MSDQKDPITQIITPVRVEYTYSPGIASERCLRGVREGKLLGAACDECGRVYVPSRGACPRCAAPTSEFREVSDRGTVITFCVVRVPAENIDVELPYCTASVLLDGADISFTALIQGCPFEEVRIGMRVEAVWKPESEWDFSVANIKYFQPLAEDDVPFKDIKEYS